MCKVFEDVFEVIFVFEGMRTVFAQLFASGMQLLARARLLIDEPRVYHPQQREHELVDHAQVALLFVDLSAVLAK